MHKPPPGINDLFRSRHRRGGREKGKIIDIFHFFLENIALYHPCFLIDMKPPARDFMRIARWFRFPVPADTPIELPTRADLEAKADEIEKQHRHEGYKCTVDIGVGYVEGEPHEQQFYLDPTVIATYEAKTPAGDSVRETLYYCEDRILVIRVRRKRRKAPVRES